MEVVLGLHLALIRATTGHRRPMLVGWWVVVWWLLQSSGQLSGSPILLSSFLSPLPALASLSPSQRSACCQTPELRSRMVGREGR